MKNLKGTRKQKELVYSMSCGAKLSFEQLNDLVRLGWALQNGTLTSEGQKIAAQAAAAVQAARQRITHTSDGE